MVFIIFIIAWLILLMIFTTSRGKIEDNPLSWLLIGVIVLCAVYSIFAVSILAGLSMFGSLSAFEVIRKK